MRRVPHIACFLCSLAVVAPPGHARAEVSKQMHAFDRLVARHAPRQPFAGALVIKRQHALESNARLTAAEIRSGARADEILFLSKEQSEHPPVIQSLGALGVNAVASSKQPTRVHQMIARQVVMHLLSDPRAKVMLVDDAGELVNAVALLFQQRWVPLELARRIVAVEQTPMGTNLLAKRQLAAEEAVSRGARFRAPVLPFPLVDVGHFWGKRRYESPLIGRSVAVSTDSRLEHLRLHGVEHLDPQKGRVRLLLAGLGNVNKNAARHLKAMGYALSAADPEAVAAATALGIPRYDSLRQALLAERPQVLLSATGDADVFEQTASVLPDRLVIVNGASRREMDAFVRQNAKTSRRGAETVAFAGRIINPTVGEDFAADEVWRSFDGKRQFYLPRGGKVINFGGPDPIPPIYIQVIRGLMYLGELRASELFGAKPGIYKASAAKQRAFIADVQRELEAAGLGSLDDPSF